MSGFLFIVLFLARLQPAPQTASGFAVNGHVVRSAAVPATAARRVVLSEMNGAAAPAESTVNADGSFQFSKVQPGTYRAQIPLAGADWTSEVVNVVVVDHDVSGVEVGVRAMVGVTWTLEVESSGLRPTVTLQLVPFRGGPASAARSIALNDAVTSRAIPEGEYRVSWSPLPSGYEMKAVTVGSVDALNNRLKIDGAGAPPQVTIMLGVSNPPPWVKVSGRVLSLSSSPLPNAIGILLEDSANLSQTPQAPVAADGSFEFSRVLPGAYRPMLTGGQALQIMSPTTLVVPNADLTGIRIAVTALKQITGKVIMEGPKPVRYPGLMVIAVNRFQTSFRPEPDGSFTVAMPVGSSPTRLVAPGYTVRVFTYGASNLLQEPLNIGVTDAAELRVTLTLDSPPDDSR